MDTKALRKILGISQDKFAAMLGVSPYTVRRWESGKVNPSPLAVEKLAILQDKLLAMEDIGRA